MKNFILRAYSFRDFDESSGVDFALLILSTLGLIFVSTGVTIMFVMFSASFEHIRLNIVLLLLASIPMIKTKYEMNKTSE